MHDYDDSKIAMEESRMREMKQHMQWRTEVETLQRQQQQLETVSAPGGSNRYAQDRQPTAEIGAPSSRLVHAFHVRDDLKSVSLTLRPPRACIVGPPLAQRRAQRARRARDRTPNKTQPMPVDE